MFTLLISACVGLPQGHLAYGSKNDWKIYETRIDDVILQYSLPNGQSTNSPKIGIPKKIIISPPKGEVINIFHGFWDFKSSSFKPIDGNLKCSIGVSKLKTNIRNINDYKENLELRSFQQWQISNKKN